MSILAKWAITVLSAVALTSTAVAETPVKGGTLKFAVVAEPPNYDCHSNVTFGVTHPVAPHYSMLLKFHGSTYPEVSGDLAQSWTAAADGLAGVVMPAILSDPRLPNHTPPWPPSPVMGLRFARLV